MKIAVLIKQVPASNDVAIDPVTHCLIRENTEIPAIFLTARDEETDMLTAFDTGADDYVVKPFSMKVLLKRIEAVIGRNNREKQLVCGEIILFPDKKQYTRTKRKVSLQPENISYWNI